MGEYLRRALLLRRVSLEWMGIDPMRAALLPPPLQSQDIPE